MPWAVAPVGVFDGGEGVVVVAAPFGLAEAGIAAECDPVRDHADELVFLGTGG
jgi:hypothetical protein